MFWLQSPPWGRWLLAGLIALFAIWVEFRPATMIDHPFASRPIARGETISPANTTSRPVPESLLEPIADGAIARRDIPEGAPVLNHDIGGSGDGIPEGWWIVTLEVPPTARSGDRVRVVVVDTGQVVEGLVATAADPDPFASRSGGGVAIPGEHAAVVAAAAVNGRVVVLVSTG